MDVLLLSNNSLHSWVPKDAFAVKYNLQLASLADKTFSEQRKYALHAAAYALWNIPLYVVEVPFMLVLLAFPQVTQDLRNIVKSFVFTILTVVKVAASFFSSSISFIEENSPEDPPLLTPNQEQTVHASLVPHAEEAVLAPPNESHSSLFRINVNEFLAFLNSISPEINLNGWTFPSHRIASLLLQATQPSNSPLLLENNNNRVYGPVIPYSQRSDYLIFNAAMLRQLVASLAPPEEEESDFVRVELVEDEQKEDLSSSFVDIRPEDIPSSEEMLSAVSSAAKPKPFSLFDLLRSHQHPSKDMKYLETLYSIGHKLEEGFLKRKPLENYIASLNRADFPHTIQTLESLILKPSQPSSALIRQQYCAFINNLRLAISEGHPVVSEICYLQWAETSLNSYLAQLVTFICGKSLPRLTLANLGKVFEKANHTLNTSNAAGVSPLDRNGHRLEGTLNVHFDPTGGKGRNIPRVRFHLSLPGKTVKGLQHATPCIQNEIFTLIANFFRVDTLKQLGANETMIAPNYLAFLQAATKRKEHSLHVIFEKTKKHSIGDESTRARARLNLEPLVSPLALCMDNSFFKHKVYTTLSQLKQNLVNEMVTSSDYHLPESLFPQQNRKQYLTNLFTEVQTLFFIEDHLRDLKDQQAYVLLCYTYLILDTLVSKPHINMLEMACKDAIDRAGMAWFILEIIILFLKGDENNDAILKDSLYATLGAPYMVRKTGVLEDRAVFALNVLAVLNRLTPDQRKTVRERSRFSALAPHLNLTFPKESQDIFPTAHTTLTLKAYKEFLSRLFSTDPWRLPSYEKNMLEEMTKDYRLQNGSLNAERIKHQVARDMNVWPYIAGDKPVKTFEELDSYLERQGITSLQDRLALLACCQQGLTAPLFKALSSLLNSKTLQISLLQDPEKRSGLDGFQYQFTIHVDKNKQVTIQATFLSHLVRLDELEAPPLARLAATTTVLLNSSQDITTHFTWMVREPLTHIANRV